MFLSNWIIFKIVLAAVTGLVDYPLAADVLLVYDGVNKLYLSGNSLDYVSNIVLYKGETSYDLTGIICTSEQKIQGSNSNLSDNFGHAVSIHGNYAIVGAENADINATRRSGSAYIFERDITTGIWSETFTTGSQGRDQIIGNAVAIEGDHAIVGAYYHATRTGRVFFIKRSPLGKWSIRQNFAGAALEDRFGWSVSISGYYAIVGAPNRDVGGTDTGMAYIYKRDAVSDLWVQTQQIQAPVRQTSAQFGYRVDISGDYAIIGAYSEDDGGILDTGAAYIFKRDTDTDTWIVQAKLVVSDTTFPYRNFGRAVRISGDYAIIGSTNRESEGYVSVGAAYIFKRSGTAWSQEAKLAANDGSVNSQFGISVGIQGDRAIVGAYGEKVRGNNVGVVYVFKRDSNTGVWSQKSILVPTDATSNDRFGDSISIDGNNIISGGYAHDSLKGIDAGAAYIYEFQEVTDYYISQPGTYRADLQICGIDYKTNEIIVNDQPSVTEKNFNQHIKIIASDGSATDRFGQSVSISGEYAIIGAVNNDTLAVDAGAAYIFKRDGTTGVWSEQQKLLASDGVLSDGFGISVAIDGDYAIVGARNGDGISADTGSAYIFKRDVVFGVETWIEQQKIFASDGVGNDQFGYSVDISGYTVIIGAYNDNGAVGCAYIFVFDTETDTWIQITQTPIKAGDPAASDLFGWSVSISGDYAIVGAREEDPGGTSNAGAAYIFKRNGTSWIQQVKLEAFNKGATDRFGWSVAIDGDYAIVGSYLEDYGGGINDSGAAYIFKRDIGAETWTLQELLRANGPELSSQFGNSVDISGNYAIVGSRYEDILGTDTGAAFIFKRNTGTETWFQHMKLIPSDLKQSDHFSESVAISGDRIIVGAFIDDNIRGNDAGAAYIYTLDPIATLAFDGYNQLTLVNTPITSYSKIGYYSNVYDIGTLNRDIIINKTGSYTSLTVDTRSNAAYFSNLTVSSEIVPYKKYNISKQQKLVASDGVASDQFGNAVDVDGDYMIIGSYLDDDKGSNSGAAYIFKRIGTTWVEYQKLVASDGLANDQFGYSVAISGDTVIIGAYLDDNLTPAIVDVGSAYIFKRDITTGVWIEQEKITADDGLASDQFGRSVAIYGDYAIVGAFLDDNESAILNVGSAYIFKYDGLNWIKQQKIFAYDELANDRFGISVDIYGDTVIVGMYLDDNERGGDAGAVYIFKRYTDIDTSVETWIFQQKLVASDGAASDQFGYSISIYQDYVIVGAHLDDNESGILDVGAAYIFKRDATTGVWSLQQKLESKYQTATDYFGESVYIFGDYAIVGARLSDFVGQTDCGAAYIFKRNAGTETWSELQKIVASDRAVSDDFGFSVAISGDYAIVGARLDDDKGGDSGSVYVYPLEPLLNFDTYNKISINGGIVPMSTELTDPNGDTHIIRTATDIYIKDTGVYDTAILASSSFAFANVSVSTIVQIDVYDYTVSSVQELVANDGILSDEFGFSVSISGNYVIIGAKLDDDNGVSSGSAYIFFRSGTVWSQHSKLVADDGSPSAKFGWSVAIDGDYAIVGAPDDQLIGAAYIFKRDGISWTQQQKLSLIDGVSLDSFGISVAIEGNTAIVGAHLDNDTKGAVYIYVRSGETTWTLQQIITASDGVANEEFGYSVAISGDYLIVGSPLNDEKGDNSGSSYIYVRNGATWSEQTKLVASDGVTNDRFGYSVDISGDTAIIGALWDDDEGVDSGSAYMFIRIGDTWIQHQKLVPIDGAASDLFGSSVSISGDYVSIGAPQDDDKGANSGSVYIFKRIETTWTLHKKLVASDGLASDQFGRSVEIYGGDVIVGAYIGNGTVNGVNVNDCGTAYIYTAQNVIPTLTFDTNNKLTINNVNPTFTKLTDPSGKSRDIGTATDIIVKDKGEYKTEIISSNIFVYANAFVNSEIVQFKKFNPVNEQKITVTDGAATDLFGLSVSISGDYMIIGTPQDDDKGVDSGSVYIFKRDGTTEAWIRQQKIVSDDGVAGDRFGQSVDIYGDTVIIGAQLDDDKGASSGSAYIYVLDGTTGVWSLQQKLVQTIGAANDQFGISVAIYGDTVIIGAIGDNGNVNDSGTAYIFNRDGTSGLWSEQQKLLTSDGLLSDNFGWSVEIDGNYAIVGSPLDDDKGSASGSAYIFILSGGVWIVQQKLVASDEVANDQFGSSVAIFGDYAIVGAPLDDDKGVDSGSAYIFKRDGTSWILQQKLVPTDLVTLDNFGWSVSIDGDHVIVGARLGDGIVANSGTVYIYKRDGLSGLWLQQQKITASDGLVNNEFGKAVAIDGNYMVVGASGKDGSVGAAYIYPLEPLMTFNTYNKLIINDTTIGSIKLTEPDGNTYALVTNTDIYIKDIGEYEVEITTANTFAFANTFVGSVVPNDLYDFSLSSVQKIITSDGILNDEFGYSASISGDYMIIGAQLDDDKGSASGSAYIFKRNGTAWIQYQKIVASDGLTNDAFGYSVSIYGEYAIVGARLGNGIVDGVNVNDCGTAYIFKYITNTGLWTEQTELVANDRAVSDFFGVSVSIFGDYVIVGANGDDGALGVDYGSAYIFKRDTGAETWSQQYKLVASDGAVSDNFGSSVAISGDYAIVGAYGNDGTLGVNYGSAYIFKRDTNEETWTEQQILLTSDGAVNDNFGGSVSISGDYAIVGARLDDNIKGVDAGAAYIFKRDGVNWNEWQKLIPSDGVASDNFGNQVAIDGDHVIIGSFLDDDKGVNSGSAYIFVRNTVTDTWYEQYKLAPIDGVTLDEFGGTVAIDGNTVVVGTRLGDGKVANTGTAYIYTAPNMVPSLTFDGYNKLAINSINTVISTTLTEPGGSSYNIGTATDIYINNIGEYKVVVNTGDTLAFANVNVGAIVSVVPVITDINEYIVSSEQKLIATDGIASDEFGYKVAISGDYAIVGARLDDDKGSASGSVYIYVKIGTIWVQQQKLVASDGLASDSFGESVSIYKNYAIVGAKLGDGIVANCGAAYIFVRNETTEQWTQQQKIQANDGILNDEFGISVAIYEGIALVGARLGDLTAVDSGTVYTFVRTGTTWSQTQEIQASDFALNDFFGWSVAISSDFAIIGSYNDDTIGSAYIYNRNVTSFSQTYKAIASDTRTASDWFGYSVDIDGIYAIIGAPLDDDKGSASGSAYIFKYDQVTLTWSQHQKLVASDGLANDQFGWSVGISGDYAIIGSKLDDNVKGVDAGSIYIFKRDITTNIWSEQQILFSNVGVTSNEFGASVAIDGRNIIVGARLGDGYVANSGSAFIYSFPDDNTVTTLTFDGLNDIFLSNTITGTFNTFLEGSNVLACGTDIVTYTVPKAGIYSSHTKSSNVFSFLNELILTDFIRTYQFPPLGGTISSLTTDGDPNDFSTWTISGAPYGNGQYRATSSIGSVSGNTPYNAFTNNIYYGFSSTTSTTGTLVFEFPEVKTIRKYVLYPIDTAATTTSVPGSNTDPTLSLNNDNTNRPKSWTLEAGQNGIDDWELLENVINRPPSIYGDVHTISSPGSYLYYRINVYENNGGTGLKIGEFQLWGDLT